MRDLYFLPFVTLVLLVLLLSCCGRSRTQSPEESFQIFQDAISGKDFSAVWDMLSHKSQADFDKHFFERAKEEVFSLPKEKQKEKNAVLCRTGEEIVKMSTKEFFVLLMEQTGAGQELMQKAHGEVASVKVSGTTAKIVLRENKEEVTLVKEGKAWKIEL